jgi:hypothetical protein
MNIEYRTVIATSHYSRVAIDHCYCFHEVIGSNPADGMALYSSQEAKSITWWLWNNQMTNKNMWSGALREQLICTAPLGKIWDFP